MNANEVSLKFKSVIKYRVAKKPWIWKKKDFWTKFTKKPGSFNNIIGVWVRWVWNRVLLSGKKILACIG